MSVDSTVTGPTPPDVSHLLERGFSTDGKMEKFHISACSGDIDKIPTVAWFP
jgi:hypothetical protein